MIHRNRATKNLVAMCVSPVTYVHKCTARHIQNTHIRGSKIGGPFLLSEKYCELLLPFAVDRRFGVLGRP